MYDALVDKKRRVMDLGATSVWLYVSDDLGQPALLGVESVAAVHGDLPSLGAIRELALARLRAIAALPDGSPSSRRSASA